MSVNLNISKRSKDTKIIEKYHYNGEITQQHIQINIPQSCLHLQKVRRLLDSGTDSQMQCQSYFHYNIQPANKRKKMELLSRLNRFRQWELTSDTQRWLRTCFQMQSFPCALIKPCFFIFFYDRKKPYQKKMTTTVFLNLSQNSHIYTAHKISQEDACVCMD